MGLFVAETRLEVRGSESRGPNASGLGGAPGAACGVLRRPGLTPSESVEWGSPGRLVHELAVRWARGAFDLDVAASVELHVCDRYFTVADDGLVQSWVGRCWLNPPYGRPEGAWVAKAVAEVLSGRAELVVALLPAKTGKPWWSNFVVAASSPPGTIALRPPVRAVEFLPTRLNYVRTDTGESRPAAFSSVAILFGGAP